MICVSCKKSTDSYLCHGCRDGAREIIDDAGRVKAVLLETMEYIPVYVESKSTRRCVSCKANIYTTSSQLCKRCNEHFLRSLDYYEKT